MTVLWIFLAGGAGSAARHLVGLWAFDRLGTAFPYGTLVVNLAGCFALGAFAHVAAAWALHPELRAAVAVGLLGGFTTYSSFNHETLALLAGGSTVTALMNVALTLMGGLAAGWLGLAAARLLSNP
jgi:fluoride exporter